MLAGITDEWSPRWVIILSLWDYVYHKKSVSPHHAYIVHVYLNMLPHIKTIEDQDNNIHI